MATIQDVAKAAGVSTATVSRVLAKPDKVREQTRIDVMAIVERLGYQPNYAAKSLRTTRTSKILAIVPDISNPFFSMVIQGVEEAAKDAGYAVLLGDTRFEPEREDEYGAMLRSKEADGLIFLGYRLPETVRSIVEDLGVAAPIVNACEFSSNLGVSSVHIDNVGAAREAMIQIYDRGHRTVGIVTGPLASPISLNRLSGAVDEAQKRGLAGSLSLGHGDFTISSGAEAATKLLQVKDRPTAIFCFNDLMAMGALASARKLGLTCPGDLSIVGFDDLYVSAFLDPPLTTIRQPAHEIGAQAVRQLLRILDDDQEDITRLALPHVWVERESLSTLERR